MRKSCGSDRQTSGTQQRRENSQASRAAGAGGAGKADGRIPEEPEQPCRLASDGCIGSPLSVSARGRAYVRVVCATSRHARIADTLRTPRSGGGAHSILPQSTLAERSSQVPVCAASSSSQHERSMARATAEMMRYDAECRTESRGMRYDNKCFSIRFVGIGISQRTRHCARWVSYMAACMHPTPRTLAQGPGTHRTPHEVEDPSHSRHEGPERTRKELCSMRPTAADRAKRARGSHDSRAQTSST